MKLVSQPFSSSSAIMSLASILALFDVVRTANGEYPVPLGKSHSLMVTASAGSTLVGSIAGVMEPLTSVRGGATSKHRS